ncbi:acyltransferase family protein [Sphingomonas sp.]|uniref:acyltransferase family protein n=1 Tax=Sphingomonas sp. TaxID=28214 RepID=UPI003B39FE72
MRHYLGLLTQPTGAIRETFYSIDILRGLAAISILVFHYTHFTMGNGALAIAPERLDTVPILRDLGWLRANGALAVQLFWTISGFVFMNVYAGEAVGARTFFVNRLARLYPLHLLTLLIVAAVQAVSMGRFGPFLIYPDNSAAEFVRHLFFASAWWDAQRLSFNGPVWSVSVEILIYLAFWAYVRVTRPSLLTAGVLAGVFLLLSAATQNLIFLCGAFFFAGAAGYACFVLTPVRSRGMLAVFWGLVLIVWTLALLSGRIDRLPLTIRLVGLFVPALLLLASGELMGLQPFFKRLRTVGDITYSTYMWHTPLQMLFLLGAGFGLYPVTIALGGGFFLAYLLVVIAFAYTSYRMIERPAQAAVRARFLHTRKPRTIISAP